MRARYLAAIGLIAGAGCRDPETAGTNGTSPPRPPATTEASPSSSSAATAPTPPAPPSSSPTAPPVASAPATPPVAPSATSPEPVEAAPDPPDARTIKVLSSSFTAGASTWDVTYSGGGAPGVAEPSWCNRHTARCQVPSAPGAGALGCAPTLTIPCGCTPGTYCKPDARCGAPLAESISRGERGKSARACCYAMPSHCVAPWQGRVLRDEGGARVGSGDDAVATEHAAAFAFRVAAEELRLVGAPDALVAGALAAERDEVRHARDLAALGDGVIPVDVAPRAPRRRPLAELAVETFFDACCAETLGAVVAWEHALHAPDPTTGAVHAAIAADEERHAELAWATLRWLVAEGGDPVREAVRRATSGVAWTSAAEPVRAIVEPCLRAALAA